MERFRDRAEAGRVLADRLTAYRGRPDVLVLGLPRGGVPVAFEVARALGVPLDVFLVRKLGVPGHEELAMGALASGGQRVLNEDVVRALRIEPETLVRVTAAEARELQRRERAYRDDRPPPDVAGKVAILIDDGLATGSTMRAAVAALKRARPARLVVAVPVASAATCAELAREVDEVVAARLPEPFYAVGLWYDDFSQTSDDEVRDLLSRAGPPASPASALHPGRSSAGEQAMDAGTGHRLVRIAVGPVALEGDLTVPEGTTAVVLFAHGSGSSRHSPRNRAVAEALRQGGLATLLIDLLTAEEEESERRTRHLRFAIGLLASRLVAATDWLASQPETRHLKVGYFGASTGAGAALVAAAERPERVGAVVSRGGRPDLAGEVLGQVQAPTLLIVGGDDAPVLGLNREAMARMTAPTRLDVIPGATHLFEEPGALEEVARRARDWFATHLVATR